MVDSDSSLSSPPSTDDEMPVEASKNGTKATPQKKKQGNILTFFKQKDRSPSPPRKKREPSPEHVYVPEDNPDIAFIVMFRSRFNEAFPRGAPHLGPQDIELGVAEGPPSADVEGLLCALLGLVLNRKKPVEKGHYGRALEESIQTQKSQWPRAWNGANPISGGRNFLGMTALERITLLHTLSLWSLNQNEQVKTMIANAYKSRTTKDRLDTNIPLSVQPWGLDGDKRRYWLVEGQNDTHFRVYRETDPHKTKKVKWFSVAGDIDELRVVATKLEEEDGRKEAKALSERMINAIPRFEASEVKRKRREYRLNRNATFTRPDPGFSLYEGRTRGKRLRYTFSDEEDFDSDNLGARRSTRTSGRETPAVPSGPTVTASGRQVRSRATGLYGETLLSGQVSDRASPATGDYVRSDASEEPHQPHAHGRATRNAPRGTTNGRPLKHTLESDDEEDATSWDGGDEDEDEPEQMELDEDEDDQADDSSDDEEEPQSLVVTLRYGKGSSIPSNGTTTSKQVAPDAERTNGIISNGSHPDGAAITDPVAPQQPEQQPPAPMEPSIQPAPPPPPVAADGLEQPVAATHVPNDTPALPPQPPTAPVPQAAVLPKLEGMFPAPQQQQPVQYPTGQPAPFVEKPQQQPTLPSPTPGANWQ
ncbi:hypothetical protein HBH69_197970 [Parastagonospora nodorum]|nr:hypothetical protein HBH61_212470 [Parastagonospora nodorum]KAH5142509.1 hypothetical protein HBH69_197970 [Parastagonospora nodorum]KAH5635949.1 hypothetical protein HBI23_211140 [Parastagonospora nodorum]KAH5993429.1 hypothetical protein HBI82_181610 [Parastagonospora nodorum]